MGVKQTLENLEKVEQIATLAGLKAHVDDQEMRVVLGFNLGEGRGQLVYVRDTSKEPEHPVITIYSPCLLVKKGLFRGVSKSMALELLRANECIHFARYGIFDSDTHSMIVASIDHLLDNLDPAEFETSVLSVAMAADSYEKRWGKDDY